MMHVKIITPNGLYKECDATQINARSVEGDFGVLSKHVPLVCMLEISKLQIVNGSEKKDYAISGGLFHLKDDQVNILTDSIEGNEEIDMARAEAAEKRARKRLDSKDVDINMKRAEIALEKAINRIKIKNVS